MLPAPAPAPAASALPAALALPAQVPGVAQVPEPLPGPLASATVVTEAKISSAASVLEVFIKIVLLKK
jgi:hypothetical protein